MKLFFITIAVCIIHCVHAQDCIMYWNECNKHDTTTNYYSVVKDASKSLYIADNESMDVYFDLIKGRDYRLSVCTNYDEGKPILRFYNTQNMSLMYDNTQFRDTASSVEIEMDVTYKVKAVVSLPAKPHPTVGLLYIKPKRYCIGYKLETMITRK